MTPSSPTVVPQSFSSHLKAGADGSQGQLTTHRRLPRRSTIRLRAAMQAVRSASYLHVHLGGLWRGILRTRRQSRALVRGLGHACMLFGSACGVKLQRLPCRCLGQGASKQDVSVAAQGQLKEPRMPGRPWGQCWAQAAFRRRFSQQLIHVCAETFTQSALLGQGSRCQNSVMHSWAPAQAPCKSWSTRPVGQQLK